MLSCISRRVLYAALALIAVIGGACTADPTVRYQDAAAATSTVTPPPPPLSTPEPPAPADPPTPTPIPTPEPPLEEVTFRQSGGLLECPDGETRMGFMYWSDDARLPTPLEVDRWEEYQELLTVLEPGGFFGYSDAAHLGTSLMSPVSTRPLPVDGSTIAHGPSDRLAATLDSGLECVFHNNVYTTFTAYRGSFECSEIDADNSYLLREHPPGDKLFLAWHPSNGSGAYIQSILDDGAGTFTARGIDKGGVIEVVSVDFDFEEELVNRRNRLTMTGELFYQDDPTPQSCEGEWTAWTLPAGVVRDDQAEPTTTGSVPAAPAPSAPAGAAVERDDLRYVHDSDTKVWATDITVFDQGNVFPMPDDVLVVERGNAVDRDHITIEMDWVTDDGTRVSVNFYTRHDGEEWWSYEVRTKVDYPDEDGDWVYYPGDNETFFWGRANGVYFTSPLGVAYEGELDLETLVVSDLRVEAFGAEYPVDSSRDLGERPARLPYRQPDRSYRFQTNNALIDVGSVEIIVDGERYAPSGDIRVSNERSYVGHRGFQELQVSWQEDPDGPRHGMDLYFRDVGRAWVIERIRVTRGDDRADLRDIGLAMTPIGDVFEGDIVTENIELRDIRIQLIGCDGPPELTMRPGCRLED